ncbi:MAG: RodZ domain-containing protein [Gammaproteobacteria bacterium]
MADSDQPAAAAAATVSNNLGQLLREARDAKDLTVDQIATELRIEARQLAALEDNRFEQIGPPVFVKGYIRQYGQRLGLDPRALMEAYGRQTNVQEVQVRPTKPIKLRDERQITVWIVALLLLLLVAVGLGVWYLNGGAFEFTSSRVPNPSASVERAPAPAESAPAVTEVASVDTRGDAKTPVVDVEPPRASAAAAPVTAAPTVAATGGGVSRAATPISLDLTFDSESWAEITDVRGQKLFFELGTTGRHAVMRGEPPVSVTFGNGDAVRLAVDGERYTIPTQGRQGKLVHFTIGSD